MLNDGGAQHTSDPEQLALFEAGEVVPVYAYNFIITHLSWGTCELEAWSRRSRPFGDGRR